MDEEEKVEEKVEDKGKKNTVDTKENGVKYETTPIIERAREEREKIEVATAAQKVENDRAELIMAKKELGGAEVGSPSEKKEYTEEEKASRARIKAIGDAGGSPWAKNYE